MWRSASDHVMVKLISLRSCAVCRRLFEKSFKAASGRMPLLVMALVLPRRPSASASGPSCNCRQSFLRRAPGHRWSSCIVSSRRDCASPLQSGLASQCLLCVLGRACAALLLFDCQNKIPLRMLRAKVLCIAWTWIDRIPAVGQEKETSMCMASVCVLVLGACH